jgi:hypothetical protein
MTCYHNGEEAMARMYLGRLPELYFLKTEYAAFLLQGRESMEEIRKTENVCFEILAGMLALRQERFGEEKAAERAKELFALYRQYSEHQDHAGVLETLFERGKLTQELFS